MRGGFSGAGFENKSAIAITAFDKVFISDDIINPRMAQGPRSTIAENFPDRRFDGFRRIEE